MFWTYTWRLSKLIVAKLFALPYSIFRVGYYPPVAYYPLKDVATYLSRSSYALLRHITPSSVVCLSLFLSLCQCVTLVSSAKTAETIKLPFAFRTRVGPMNHVLHEVQMPTWEEAILRGNRQTIVNNKTLRSHLCKDSWTDWGAVWVVGSHAPNASIKQGLTSH